MIFGAPSCLDFIKACVLVWSKVYAPFQYALPLLQLWSDRFVSTLIRRSKAITTMLIKTHYLRQRLISNSWQLIDLELLISPLHNSCSILFVCVNCSIDGSTIHDNQFAYQCRYFGHDSSTVNSLTLYCWPNVFVRLYFNWTVLKAWHWLLFSMGR